MSTPQSFIVLYELLVWSLKDKSQDTYESAGSVISGKSGRSQYGGNSTGLDLQLYAAWGDIFGSVGIKTLFCYESKGVGGKSDTWEVSFAMILSSALAPGPPVTGGMAMGGVPPHPLWYPGAWFLNLSREHGGGRVWASRRSLGISPVLDRGLRGIMELRKNQLDIAVLQFVLSFLIERASKFRVGN